MEGDVALNTHHRRAGIVAAAVALVTLLIFWASPVTVQGQRIDNDDFTLGRTNGRGYLKLDMQARVALLAGIDDGMVFLADEGIVPIEKVNRYTVPGFYVSDFATQLNAFYKDTANIRIPVTYAYNYAARKSKGESPRDLENFLANLRKIWSTR